MLERLAAGLPVGASVVTASDGAEPDAVYTWATRREGGRRARHVVQVRCRRYPRPRLVARTTDDGEALRRLVHDAEFRIAMYASDDVFLHAAAVEWEGRAVVVPGASFSGKSTLAAALLRAGAGYLSDEYAVLDARGHVAPFARRLMLRDQTGHLAARPHATELGARVLTRALPLGAVVLTRWEAGAHWEPRQVTRAAAMFAMLEHAIDVRARPEQAFARVAASLGHGAIALAGTRGDADETAGRLLACLTRLFEPSTPG